MIANGVTEAAQKKAILITWIGALTFSLLRSIATPKGVKNKGYDALIEILREHFSPKPSEVGQWFKFNACIRKSGESVETFMANLRSFAEHCNFGTSLELMLRDCLVYGINDKAIQKRLLAEPGDKLTFKRAVELSQEMEAADRDMRLLHTYTGKRDLPVEPYSGLYV